MNAHTLLPLLSWTVLVSTAIAVGVDPIYRRALSSNWRVFCLLLLVTIAWRTPLDGVFFKGLEYEDSYVYAVVGRALSLDTGAPSNSFLTHVCSDGSLLSCRTYEFFSGHYIGFPYIISLLNRAFGYWPDSVNVASVLASVLALLAVWIIGYIADGSRTAIAASSVFALTPVFSSYGVAAFAEPMSNALTAVVAMFGVRLLNGSFTARAWFPGLAALSAVSLISILVKRENALVSFLLGSALTLRWFVEIWRGTQVQRTYLYGAMGYIVLILYFTTGVLSIDQTVASETVEFGQYPFSWNIVRTLVPVFARAFAEWSWYLVGAPLVALGITLGLRRLRPTTALVIGGAALGYFGLYTSHVRSYYMLNYGDVTEHDALRYAMNLMWLWSLLAGLGASTVAAWFRPAHSVSRPVRTVAPVALATSMLLTSFYYTQDVRHRAVENEILVRIAPAVETLTVASRESAPIISPELLLLQMYASPTMHVVDFRSLEPGSVDRLLGSTAASYAWYLAPHHYQTPEDADRYSVQFAELAAHPMAVAHQGDGYTVFKVYPHR